MCILYNLVSTQGVGHRQSTIPSGKIRMQFMLPHSQTHQRRIPIQTSPGRSGFGPSLEMVYESGSASSNGAFGQGWRLAGVDSISRKSSITVPTYDDDQDTFVHSLVGDLVLTLDASGHKPLEQGKYQWQGVLCKAVSTTGRIKPDTGRALELFRWHDALEDDVSGEYHNTLQPGQHLPGHIPCRWCPRIVFLVAGM